MPLKPKPSRRDQCEASSIFQEDSFFTAKTCASPSTLNLTPRKQRILRPVESNSRLLRKLSDESLASPEKRPGSERRARRVRSGTQDIDMDVGRKRNLMYAKSLARSVAGRELKKASSRIDVLDDPEVPSPRKIREEEKKVTVELETEPEEETSILCGDEEDVAQEAEEQQVETNDNREPSAEVVQENESEDEDDDIVLPVRSTQRRPQRRIESDSESEYEEEAAAKDEQEEYEEELEEPQPLVSMRPPHRKGHSTISNWAQEVIDLTDSPKAPDSFVLPELTRARSSSFAASRPTTSSSEGPVAILA